MDNLTHFSPKESQPESYFSWRKCDFGDSTECDKGGDRYDVVAIDADGERVELSVCVDCYLKLFA